MHKEGALIAFTLISQLVVGSLLFYTFIYFNNRSSVSRLASGIHIKTPEFLLCLGIVIATIISFLHLGSPQNAIHALNNIATSWISREILGLTLFSLSLFLLFLGRWLLSPGKVMISFLFLFSALTGIVFILMMTGLYMIPTVISWATWYTPFNFAITTLILGICGVLAYSLIFKPEIEKTRLLLQILVFFLLLEAISLVLNYNMLNRISIPLSNEFLSENLHFTYMIIRIAIIASVLVFLQYIIRKKPVQGSMPNVKLLMAIAILLMLFEQLAGRYMFYATFVKTGI